MASRSLLDLNPETRKRAEMFVAKCATFGIEVLIYCTYRSEKEQEVLYAQGRTTTGPNPRRSKPMGDIVTNARGGQSWHNFRAAFDFVPLVGGKAAWSDKGLYEACGKIAESLDLEWAGRRHRWSHGRPPAIHSRTPHRTEAEEGCILTAN